ncbi:hypothetical protein [Coleofasciculus sp. FACHB-1120]|uniref:hypothetical protein n=1 Tax=Coleofasciculus sp. FACHB-1120 TaxID=2692783 RepID=UPI00168A1234|nr:hypothetical protein [Coleofasciculus sp. FACHB-1120]MBD2743175.1 hypothetical protein [Coleofasciculus sp. FACHB-1120]
MNSNQGTLGASRELQIPARTLEAWGYRNEACRRKLKLNSSGYLRQLSPLILQ